MEITDDVTKHVYQFTESIWNSFNIITTYLDSTDLDYAFFVEDKKALAVTHLFYAQRDIVQCTNIANVQSACINIVITTNKHTIIVSSGMNGHNEHDLLLHNATEGAHGGNTNIYKTKAPSKIIARITELLNN